MACGSVAAPGRPAPHEVMRFTLAREELREDRTGEGRVVELDREIGAVVLGGFRPGGRSEEHTSELQSLMRISYAVFCLKQKKNSKQEKTKRDKHIKQHTAQAMNT